MALLKVCELPVIPHHPLPISPISFDPFSVFADAKRVASLPSLCDPRQTRPFCTYLPLLFHRIASHRIAHYRLLPTIVHPDRNLSTPLAPARPRGDEAVQRRTAPDRRDTAATAEVMTGDMELLLSRLSSVLDGMTTHHATATAQSGTLLGGGGGGATTGPSPAVAHTLQRHSEILHDYQQEFRKTRSSISSLREHAELLSGSNGSAMSAADRAGRSTSALDGGSAALDGLYKERSSISAATSGADTAIATGMSLKEDLDRQRAMFASMVERMETMSEGLPAVNRLIGQIRRKKKRDVLIIGAVVSTMLFVTFSWKVIG